MKKNLSLHLVPQELERKFQQLDKESSKRTPVDAHKIVLTASGFDGAPAFVDAVTRYCVDQFKNNSIEHSHRWFVTGFESDSEGIGAVDFLALDSDYSHVRILSDDAMENLRVRCRSCLAEKIHGLPCQHATRVLARVPEILRLKKDGENGPTLRDVLGFSTDRGHTQGSATVPLLVILVSLSNTLGQGSWVLCSS